MKSLPYKIAFIFFSKMHGGQSVSIFIFFSMYPFGGISYTLPLLGFRFRFFCLFTQAQLHKKQSEPKKIFDSFIFHYTLIYMWLGAHCTIWAALEWADHLCPVLSSDCFLFNSISFYYTLFWGHCRALNFPVCPPSMKLSSYIYAGGIVPV